MPVAILNVCDTGPVESLIVMLRSVGYDCMYPSLEVRNDLRRIGCDTVLEVSSLVEGMGYEYPMRLSEAKMRDMDRSDVILVDVKGHRNYYPITKRWPNLHDRVLWYRINGGKPEHVITASGFDCGNEADPPCPVLTPNQNYVLQGTWSDRSYVCWPPFYRFDEYLDKWGRFTEWSKARSLSYLEGWDRPVCLIHNIGGWGYGALVDEMRKLGVLIFGRGSPDGVIKHGAVPLLLSRSLAMVHLKSSDAPGYSLYEALAAGCPIICTRRLIWRNKMQDLLIPGKTCLVFDRETHDPLSAKDVRECTAEVKKHLEILRDPSENRRIGLNGRNRLKEIMWSESRESDVTSLREFMIKHFGN